jgi:hypothetical protein
MNEPGIWKGGGEGEEGEVGEVGEVGEEGEEREEGEEGEEVSGDHYIILYASLHGVPPAAISLA